MLYICPKCRDMGVMTGAGGVMTGAGGGGVMTGAGMLCV